MEHYMCACPDVHDWRTGALLCERCNGLKVKLRVPLSGMTDEKKKAYEAYLKSLRE